MTTCIQFSSFSFISQNARGLKSNVKIKELCIQIKSQNILAACIQETWLNGQFIVEHDGYTFIHHGIEPNADQSKRGKEGVAIVLSRDALNAWNATGRAVLSEFGSRILAVRLICKDLRGKDVGMFLISTYAPVGTAKDSLWKSFLTNLQNCIRSKPKDDISLIGCNCNSSLGIGYGRRPGGTTIYR